MPFARVVSEGVHPDQSMPEATIQSLPPSIGPPIVREIIVDTDFSKIDASQYEAVLSSLYNTNADVKLSQFRSCLYDYPRGT